MGLTLRPNELHLYEQDFYAWTQQQRQLLIAGRFQELDIANLVEEIDSWGKQQKQELRNRLAILLGHLLKWHYQPGMRTKSWRVTIDIQRSEIKQILLENPSLKTYVNEALMLGYQAGIKLAVLETPLEYGDFPAVLPYNWLQILDESFFPD
ncbi:hypothetical protein GlitD10_0672 [Gloeomargarita lithophora Alchichica-D10]|uniref:DUF29 domain-containing protein n=1 Tax=Gloeomargarita lithophora Alchichica-D10 TaxID=1188229 RepID=A0A1J0AAM8_9CYAN|nr:DUF29 domain-containing protein [Gloeomargarita lithophora]APB32986.1 hypothetical protein GlitD10_0672 [Gloeomargarita lithophora Alchichica-D10]